MSPDKKKMDKLKNFLLKMIPGMYVSALKNDKNSTNKKWALRKQRNYKKCRLKQGLS